MALMFRYLFLNFKLTEEQEDKQEKERMCNSSKQWNKTFCLPKQRYLQRKRLVHKNAHTHTLYFVVAGNWNIWC